MKKQFFRVKQLADQTFSRAGKTELLSDELAEVDRHVEFLRHACTNTNKKLAACLLGMGTDEAAREKRLKKCPEYLLGQAMTESAVCDEHSLLREVLCHCGEVQVALAQELVNFDVRVEQCVVNPLQAVLDTDVPAIVKHKRNLSRLTLDMDSARTRYSTAVKHNTTAAGYQAKVDAVREELEDAESKVEQCRDALSSEMFQLISRESELAKTVAMYIHLQKSYHEKALQSLEKIIPSLETLINDSDMKPVFGMSLEEHLRVTGRRIALPIELCVCALLEIAMDEEGLFRVAGGASKVKRMRLCLDAGCLNLAAAVECSDPHVVAGVFKSYLRELPEPLLSHALYNDWVAAARLPGTDEVRMKALKEVVNRLPTANFDNLCYLVRFLATLAANQATNKMSPQNLAIVIAPNLIWSPDQDQTALGMNMSTANIHSFIVDNLVTHVDFFFPNNIEFYQTFHRESIDASAHVSAASKPNSLNGMLGEKGHARRSSEDTLLISYSPASSSSGDMKRTQSNSSLTDQSSPPHSPRPVTRRKNKAAPHPPKVANENERLEKPPRPVTVHIIPGQYPAVPQSITPKTVPVKPLEPQTPPPSQLKTRYEHIDDLTSIDAVKEKKVEVVQKKTPEQSTIVIAANMPAAVSTPLVGLMPTYGPVTAEPPGIVSTPVTPVTPAPDTSSVPENVRRFPVAAPRSFPIKEASQDIPEPVVEFQERPKPAIPERPAALQRHSGSFRQLRHEECDSVGKVDQTRFEKSPPIADKPEPVPLPRPSVLPDKRSSLEKPERPPKPDLPIAPVSLLPTVLPDDVDGPKSTEEDTPSETASKPSGLANSQRGQVYRPPRPQPPPPPPPPVIKQRIGQVPLTSESTDL